jgi:hypothetical protein
MSQLEHSQAESTNSPLPKFFIQVRPLTDHMRPTHIRRAISFAQFINLNVNLI